MVEDKESAATKKNQEMKKRWGGKSTEDGNGDGCGGVFPACCS
jgi:hypothetical protein